MATSQITPFVVPHLLYPNHDIAIVDEPDSITFLAGQYSMFKPLPRVSSPMFEVREAENKGLGMFAARDIDKGDLIISERPVYTYRLSLENVVRHSGEGKSFEIEAVENLSPNSRQRLYELKNSLPESCQKDKLEGILNTNFFPFHLKSGCGTHHLDHTHAGCFPSLSRANHDCCPNTNFFFSAPTFTGEFRAVRKIQKGEEITVSYIPLDDPKQMRQRALQDGYHFTCTCATCSTSSEASDMRRSELSALMGKIMAFEKGNSSLHGVLTSAVMDHGLQLATEERLHRIHAEILNTAVKCLFANNGPEYMIIQKMGRAQHEWSTLEGDESPVLHDLKL
ncbi:uncharacterized protein ARMOST_08110 [Armillaria ostoyae]|uniref:SET domain-containing protein n=1 Tax=Armillaria ostoyae TaxID=47428 RepID=A0A284R7Q7_ARMOS|nr:uncharacterized protein ARMOST_08110 [Armillaria ostoyae]